MIVHKTSSVISIIQKWEDNQWKDMYDEVYISDQVAQLRVAHLATFPNSPKYRTVQYDANVSYSIPNKELNTQDRQDVGIVKRGFSEVHIEKRKH